MKKFGSLLLLLLALCSVFADSVQAQDGFGACSTISTARLRNDDRLGRWINRGRPSSAWDFWAASNDGGSAPTTWSSFGWWTYDGGGDPTFLYGANPYPSSGSTQWSTDITRTTVLAGVSNTRTVGTITIKFKPATPNRPADPHRMEVDWKLFGTNTTNGNSTRASVTGQASDISKTECIEDTNSPAFNSAKDMGPAPSNPYSGAWSISQAGNPNHGLVEYFARLGLDQNNDGRSDWDVESEQGLVSVYDSTGMPRWLMFQDLVEAIQPRAQAKSSNLTLYRVTNGYCGWCAVPSGFSVISASAGSVNRLFSSFTDGRFYADISTTFRSGASANYTLGANPLATSGAPLIRNVSGRYDEGVAATPPAIDPQTTSFATDAISDQVGSTAGMFRVDASGSATYSLPFFVVPGSGGLQPGIGLAYHSQSGVGVAGVGWSISGLSGISRCRKTIESGDGPGLHPPVQLTDADALCLDGLRLVTVGTGTDSTGAYTEYRTELESFSRIRRYLDGSSLPWFAVWGKDGTYREFGRDVDATPTNSRLMSNNGATASTTTVFSWAMSRLQDAAGNYIRFEYRVRSASDPSLGLGEQLISKVQYTGNTGAHTAIATGNALTFDYVDLPALERSVGYTAGSVTASTKYVSAIRSYASNGAGGTAEVRSYSLQYAAQVTRTNLRRMTTITECGRSNAAASMTCLPPTNVTWNDGDRGHWRVTEPENAQYTSAASMNAKMERLKDYKFADVNGDGLQDIVWLRDLERNYACYGTGTEDVWDQIYVHFARDGGRNYEKSQYCIAFKNEFDNDRGWLMLDFDADGRDDLLVTEFASPGNPRWRVHLSEPVPGTNLYRFSATGIDPAGLDANGQPIPIAIAVDTEGLLVDVDADSLVDLVTAVRVGGADEALAVWHLRRQPFTIGTKTFPYRFTESALVEFREATGVPNTCLFSSALSVVYPDKVTATDVNGDGRADYVMKAELLCGTEAARPPAIGNYPADAAYQADLDPRSTTAPNHLDLKYGAPDDLADGSGDQRCRQEATATLPAVTTNCIYPNSRRPRSHVASVMEGAWATYWIIFTAEGIESGKKIYREYARFKADGEGATVSVQDDKFRVEDVNGDGLADVLYKRANYDTWHMRLNSGSSVYANRFLAQTNVKNKNDSGDPANVDNAENVVNQDRVAFYDYDGDGDLDFFEAKDKYVYTVTPWIGTKFSFANKFDLYTDPFDSDWSRSFVDLNSDGYMDRFSVHWDDSDGEWFVSWGHRTTGNVVEYSPLDVVTAITTATNARTEIRYAPLSFSSVYGRDYDAPYMLDSGRGSPVQDMGPGGMYVVRSVKSSAPIPSNAANLSEARYRYAGGKMQGGGRGFLGFRTLEVLEPQRSVVSRTYSLTKFPFSGLTEAAESWWTDSAPSDAVCVNRSSQTVDVNQPSAACFAPAPTCSSGLNTHCDSTVSGQRMSATANTWQSVWMTSASSGANAWSTGAFPQNTPTAIWVRGVDTSASTFDPVACRDQGHCDEIKWNEQSIGAADWDAYGNIVKSTSTTGTGASTAGTVVTTSAYSNSTTGSAWRLGRMTSTRVATTRGTSTKARNSRFEYHASTGMLSAEIVQSGDPGVDHLTTAYERDVFGNIKKTVTCSTGISVDDCRLLTSVAAVPGDSTTIRRMKEVTYDGLGRFADVTYSQFRTGRSPDATVYARNLLGQPTDLTDEVGARTLTYYGAFGATQHVSSATGAKSTNKTRWCLATGRASAVACPAGAVFRAESSPKGGAKSWRYHDAAGRAIATLSEGFGSSQYNASAVEYDSSGRVEIAYQPWAGPATGEAGAGNLANGQPRYYSQTTYDVLDRVKEVTHPSSAGTPAVTTSTYDGLTTSITTTYPDPNTGLPLRSQLKTEFRSVFGDIVRVLDDKNRAVCFTYDAHGRTVETAKSVSGTCTSDKIVTSTMTYDNLGRKSAMTDADMGGWSYGYNAAGELIQQVNPRGTCTRNRYDARGRLFWREDYSNATCTAIENTAEWTFDTTRIGRLTMEKITAPSYYQPRFFGDLSRSYSYDALGRETQVNTQIDGDNPTVSLRESYVEKTTYDQYGRVFQRFDARPNTMNSPLKSVDAGGVYFEYTPRGFLKRLREVAPGPWGEIYYEIAKMDARGRITEEYRGARAEESETVPTSVTGALVTRRSFDPATGWLNWIKSGDFGTIDLATTQFIQDQTIGYDALGNVVSRTSLVPGGGAIYNAPGAGYDSYREGFVYD